MARLVDITEDLRSLMEEIESSDGELTPEQESRLDSLIPQIEAKVDTYAALIKEAEDDAASLTSESTRLSKRKKSFMNMAGRLRESIYRSLKATGLDTVKGLRFTVGIRQAGRPRIEWTGKPEDIPKRFRKVRPPELDGDLAYAAYKEGKLPSGFAVTFTESVSIR